MKSATDAAFLGSLTVGVTLAVYRFVHKFPSLLKDALLEEARKLRSSVKANGAQLPECLHVRLVALCTA